MTFTAEAFSLHLCALTCAYFSTQLLKNNPRTSPMCLLKREYVYHNNLHFLDSIKMPSLRVALQSLQRTFLYVISLNPFDSPAVVSI